MSEPLVLVILLGTNAPHTAEGMLGAARRALGPEAVVLADTSSSESDAEALAIGERVHARAIARVAWADSTFLVARLRVHVSPSNEWESDEIAFVPQDASNEKGRTIGYALASMVQRLERGVTDRSSIAPAGLGRADGAAGSPPPAASTAPPAQGADTSRVSTKTEPTRSDVGTALDVFLCSSGALGGGATSLGGSGGLRWWPSARIGLRSAIGGRFGTIPAADATTSTLFASAGPSVRAPVSSTMELGARADFVLLHHSVTRSQPETTHKRWLGAVDLMVEGSWSFVPSAGLIAAAGAELGFGPTAVNVGGEPTATIPSVRAVAELGLRFRF
jgi:hypothetical protein